MEGSRPPKGWPQNRVRGPPSASPPSAPSEKKPKRVPVGLRLWGKTLQDLPHRLEDVLVDLLGPGFVG